MVVLKQMFCLIGLLSISCSNLCYSQFVPDLIYPHSNEVTTESNITFKWNKDVYHNLNYQFQLSTTNLFLTTVVDQITSNNSLFVGGISNFGQMYFWRVRSQQGASYSNWSEIDSFYLFSPLSISGLSVWLDPNIGVNLNGGSVQNLLDNTANINNASQSSSIQRPLFVVSDSSINNKSIMQFDGVNDFLEITDNSSIDFVDAFSIFVLVKPSIIATNKTILAKWDYQTQGSWAWQSDFSTSNQLQFTPALSITDAGNQSIKTSNANMTLLTPSILGLVYNGNLTNKVKFYKNSFLLNSITSGVLPPTIPNSTATLKIGKYGGIATRYYQGSIGEILIYNSELSATNKYLVDNYLRYKYAPPVDLGNDTIIAQNSLCGSINIRTKSRYQTYSWSTGATSSSITVSTPGTYWVTVTDFLGNISSDSIVVFPPYTMNFPTTNQLCENTSLTWSPSYPSPNFSYLWQNGSTSPSFTITQAGAYFVKITDGSGCFIKSDTLFVTVDNYASTATLGPDVNLCSGNFLTLQSGAGETVNYEWNGIATTGQPSNYQVNTSGIYTLESTNNNGCIAQDTIDVTIVGIAPIANFSTSNVCDGFSAAFDDNSVPAGAAPIDGWQWNFGDNQTSNQQNPSHLYNSPGIYPVELYVSQGICGAYFYDTIQIYTNPTVDFGYTGHCQGETIQFSNLSAAGSGAITNYYWDFGMPQTGAYNNSIIPIPNRIFDNPGAYDVEFTITDANGCKDSITQVLVIDPTPQVELLVENSCQNQEANIVNNTPTGSGLIYNWNFGDNTSSILPNPVKVYPLNGLYLITLQVGNQFGCTGIQSATITINPTPLASIDVGPACVGSYGTLTDLSSVLNGSIDSSFWIVNATDTLSGSPAGYLWNTSGQQEVELTTFSNAGCSASTSLFLDITDTLDVAFQIGSNIAAAGDPIAFNNNSIGNGVYLWNFGDGNFANEVNPEHTYGNNWIDSTFNVLLIGLNSAGCVDSAVQSLTVLEPLVDISLDQLFLDEENGWYTVGVLVTNNGTSNVTSIPFSMETEKGALFNETFSGLLYPTKDTIYVFNGKPPATGAVKDIEQAFICVNGIAYSITGLEETLLADNGICENLTDEPVALLPVYPNPAATEVTISLLVAEEANVGIDLLDARGRFVRTVLPFQSQQVGTYNYTVNVRGLSAGAYFIRMKTDDKTITDKLLIQQ